MINQGKFFCHFNLIIWKLLTFQISTKILNSRIGLLEERKAMRVGRQKTREKLQSWEFKRRKSWDGGWYGGSHVPMFH